jgi:hypothetical protein
MFNIEYQKTCLFMILSFWICSVHAQRPDSIKTDSLRKRAVRGDSLRTEPVNPDTAKQQQPIKLKTVTIRGQKPLVEQRVLSSMWKAFLLLLVLMPRMYSGKFRWSV